MVFKIKKYQSFGGAPLVISPEELARRKMSKKKGSFSPCNLDQREKTAHGSVTSINAKKRSLSLLYNCVRGE